MLKVTNKYSEVGPICTHCQNTQEGTVCCLSWSI